MGFLDKAKEAAEQAATKAKASVEDVQAKREAGQAYTELGREAFRLIEAGEVSHPSLTPLAEKVRTAEAAAPAPDGTATTQPAEAAAPAEPSAPPPPPAMPS